jgi:hypothetical protein
VAAVQLTTTLVAVMLPKVGVPGRPGGVVSAAAIVVKLPERLAPTLPAASRARTSTV